MSLDITTLRKLAGLINESAPVNYSGSNDIEKEDSQLGAVLIDLAQTVDDTRFANALSEVGNLLELGETDINEISASTGLPAELVSKIISFARDAKDHDVDENAETCPHCGEKDCKCDTLRESQRISKNEYRLRKLAGLPVTEGYRPSYSRFQSYIADPVDDDNAIKVNVEYSHEEGWEDSRDEPGVAENITIESVKDAETGEELDVSEEDMSMLEDEAWKLVKQEKSWDYDEPIDENAIGNTLTDHSELIQEDDNAEIAAELEQMAEQIMMLTHQAIDLVRDTPEYDRAKSYWYGHIMSAVGSEEYMSHGYTMVSTINALRTDDDDDDEW